MIERAPGVFEVKLYGGESSGVSEMRIFIIPGRNGQRSLMVDAGFRRRSCMRDLEAALYELEIDVRNLDIFLTHKHTDHCGLASEFARKGARLFMNPQEERHSYDCLYYSHSLPFREGRAEVLRTIGISPEMRPELWEMFEQTGQGITDDFERSFEIRDFPYQPVREGQFFCYGGYHLEALPLKGHTYGQMGLYDREKRLVFCADQVIDGIVSIVATSYADEHLLQGYFDSLARFKTELADCLLLPAHREAIRDVGRVVDRIVFSYLDKTDMIRRILDYGRGRMTVLEIACIAYGVKQAPRSENEFLRLKSVISKTFSCLEYLYDIDLALRERREGTLYWEKP